MVCWLIITAKQGGIVTITAPLNFHNLPDNLALVKNAPEEIEVQLKVFSSLITSPRNLDIVADLNLAGVKEGTSTLSISNSDIKVPLGVIITSVNPSTVRITTGKKVTKELRIRPNVKGDGEEAVKRLRIKVEPASVAVEGPEYLLRHMDSVSTEEIEYDSLRGGAMLQKRLVNPAPQVRILREEPVKVRIVRANR
jgi:YbbR domain-containing protein